jgi:hypothetical protein
VQARRPRTPRSEDLAPKSIRMIPSAKLAAYRHMNIVLVGTFNPAIFQPEWFRANELLPDSEVDYATSTKLPPGSQQRLFVSGDGTVVAFESVRLDVIADRWTLSTERPDWFADLGGLATSIFELLKHTPVSTFGVNLAEHWPKERATGAAIEERWLPLAPLARVIGERVRLGATVHATWGDYRVTLALEPSVRLQDGVYVFQNYEWSLRKGANEFAAVLGRDWTKLLSRTKEVTEAILGSPR